MRKVLVTPSPKSHSQAVIVPVDTSLKLTVKGTVPLMGLAVKSAVGGNVVTVMKLGRVKVLLPPGPLTVKLTVKMPVRM